VSTTGRCSSVGTVTSLQVGRPRNRGAIPAGQEMGSQDRLWLLKRSRRVLSSQRAPGEDHVAVGPSVGILLELVRSVVGLFRRTALLNDTGCVSWEGRLRCVRERQRCTPRQTRNALMYALPTGAVRVTIGWTRGSDWETWRAGRQGCVVCRGATTGGTRKGTFKP